MLEDKNARYFNATYFENYDARNVNKNKTSDQIKNKLKICMSVTKEYKHYEEYAHYFV